MRRVSIVMIIAFLSVFSVQTFGQKVGIQGGINSATLMVKDNDDDYSDEFDALLGFNGGITFDMEFGNFIGLQLGVIGETKGFKVEVGDVVHKMNAIYVDVPLLLKVGPKLGPVKIYGAVGPYVGVGVAGKFTTEYDGDKESEDIEWGDNADEDDLKRLDYGIKAGVGVDVSILTVGVYYGFGLANIAANQDNGNTMSTRTLSVCVGLKFGK